MRPELDFAKASRPQVTLNLEGSTPAHTGSFAPGSDTQEIKFSKPVGGRFFCLESLSAHDGGPFASVAELDLLGANGWPLSHEGWTIAYVDSEDGSPETANYWHTEWKKATPNHPHRLILNLGSAQTAAGFRYVPRQGNGDGRIKDYRVLVGDLVAPKP